MSNEFKDLMNDFTEEQHTNYELCMKYPILMPQNDDEWQYEYTKLDFFPVGWKKAFGERWAKDVQTAINKMPPYIQKEAYIMDIKEKWGQLRVFLNVFSTELESVLKKYEKLSESICPQCGKIKTEGLCGFTSYLCVDCERELLEKRKNLRRLSNAEC